MNISHENAFSNKFDQLALFVSRRDLRQKGLLTCRL